MLRKSDEGFIIVPGEHDFWFRRVMMCKPQRTGKPENWLLG